MVERSPLNKYVENSLRLMGQAEEGFDKGDLIQASEKAWGAVALAVKSIAVQRGWQHSRHDLLYAISDQIADELDRPDLDRLFRSASSLHTNFYEDWMTEGNVRGGIDDAKAYLREMEPVRVSPPPELVPQTPAQIARLGRLTAT